MGIVIDSVSLVKQNKTILQDISLEIPGGSTFVLLGPSGSGKSSLLRLLNRLDEPNAGSISYKGQPLEFYPVMDLRKKIGMLFQYPVMVRGTVRDNIALGKRLQKKDLSTERIQDLLKQVSLEGSLIDKDAGVLSGGQKQRVALARVLANDPEVLLLDEPTSALDPGAVMQVKETLLRQSKNGLTLIWVTHDIRMAEEVASRGALLVGGRVEVKGDKSELFSKDNQLAQTFFKGELILDE